jgi:hypothetical protein
MAASTAIAIVHPRREPVPRRLADRRSRGDGMTCESILTSIYYKRVSGALRRCINFEEALMNESRFLARRLRRLPSLGIASGEPDIRGWLTLADDGHRVGRVHDLIVELATGHVRHLEIALDPGLACRAGTGRLVIPVAALEVSASRRHVHVRRVRSDEIVHAPRFGAKPIGDREEQSLRRFYRCADFGSDAARFWGVRRRGRERVPYAQTSMA